MSNLSATNPASNQTCSLSPKEAIQAAKEFRAHGWNVFPLPIGQKKPDPKLGWKKVFDKVTDDNVEQMWGNGENIGVILDAPIVDVDLDCPEAVTIAPRFLPSTSMKFGHSGKLTHYVYECVDDETTSRTFLDTVEAQRKRDGADDAKEMIIEIRHENGYSMFPPSIHPDYGPIKFAPGGGWPDAVSFKDLQRRVEVIAAVSLLIRYWPGPGARNEATLALCGGLVRAEREKRIDPRAVDAIVRAVVEEGGNSDPQSDFLAVDRTRKTFEKIDAGNDKKKVKGWLTLEKMFGPNGKHILKQIRDWLNIAPKSQAKKTCVLQSAPFAGEMHFKTTRDGVVPEMAPENVRVILERDDGLRNDDREHCLYFDERTLEPWLAWCPWDDGRLVRGYPCKFDDADYGFLQSYLLKFWKWNATQDAVAKGVLLFMKTNRRNLLKELMSSWVSSDRGLLEKFIGVGDDFMVQVEQPEDISDEDFAAYCYCVTKLIFLGGAKRTLEPGAQAENMPIFEGEQGIQKSRLCRVVALGDPDLGTKQMYFAPFSGNLNAPTKDDKQLMIGKLIMEHDELESLRGASVEALKSFTSMQTMSFRPPYGRTSVDYPITWINVGTTNRLDYLSDVTGNRRYWPVKVLKIDLERIRGCIKELWGEAVSRVMDGEAHWPTEAERLLGEAQQADRVEGGVWAERFSNFLRDHEGFITGEMCLKLIGVTSDKFTNFQRKLLTESMAKIGWQKSQRKLFAGGSKVRGYYHRSDADTPIIELPLLGVGLDTGNKPVLMDLRTQADYDDCLRGVYVNPSNLSVGGMNSGEDLPDEEIPF